MDNPWDGIDPDLIISGDLSLSDMPRYWTTCQSDPGTKGVCCNCSRTLLIKDYGLCEECFLQAENKNGSELLNALTVFRTRVIPVEMERTGRIGDFDRPKVVGQVDVSSIKKRGPGRPPKDKPIEKAVKETTSVQTGKLRVCDESGRDLGTLRAMADQMLLDEDKEEQIDVKPVDFARQQTDHKTHRISRALIIEVDSAEVEFRSCAQGLDITVRDNDGVIFATFGIPISIVSELQFLERKVTADGTTL